MDISEISVRRIEVKDSGLAPLKRVKEQNLTRLIKIKEWTTEKTFVKPCK